MDVGPYLQENSGDMDRGIDTLRDKKINRKVGEMHANQTLGEIWHS